MEIEEIIIEEEQVEEVILPEETIIEG